MTSGQVSLNNFYQSVKFVNPALAEEMSDDVVSVALNALSADKIYGQPAAESLRQKSRDLPEIMRRVLENALTNLGYS